MGSIYCIENTVKNKMYVGSSKNVSKRWKTHTRTLDKGEHHNIHLQRSWVKYGRGVFKFFILEDNVGEGTLFNRESFWIDLLHPEYNIGGVGGGDNFSNHPEKERIRKIHSKNLKKLRDEGRIPPTGKGDKNPNWRGGVSGKDFCVCGNLKKVKSRLCKVCSDSSRVGNKNPFFGKKHSEETKLKIAKTKEGNKCDHSGKWKENKHSQKSLVGDGVFYTCGREAAEKLNVTHGTITHRLKSKNFPFWFLTEKEEDVSSYVEEWYCEVDNILFKTLKSVSKTTGVKETTVCHRLKSKNFPSWIKLGKSHKRSKSGG